MRKHFNPRSPHGERPAWLQCPAPWVRISIHAPRTGSDSIGFFYLFNTILFQSTLPARGATRSQHGSFVFRGISIHAPRTGSDDTTTGRDNHDHGFQSTLPARGATGKGRKMTDARLISIHAPRTGSDPHSAFGVCSVCISIHAPRTGSDKA